ncbi:inositol monophosphatase family protein [Agromyces sp. G08B096]|uniref:Inositol-1-monophosphatase n=1 Tax=Agromyces sp. G08B096 TaxID=3156399 RepID=A0AAU7W575_9MICO
MTSEREATMDGQAVTAMDGMTAAGGPPELRALAADLARRASRLVADERQAGVSVAATKSSLVDVVTAVDQASEAFIRAALAELRPDDGFIGEESGSSAGASGLTWVVDPIDGTVNFLYGIPAYAVSIAVMSGSDPFDGGLLAGAVANPATGEIWSASRGGGAFLDGRPVRASAAGELSLALVGTGFSYLPERRRAQGAMTAELLPRVRDLRRIGAAALDLCAVATGRLDGYVERWLNPWDYAAGVLIAEEAGAAVSATEPAADGSRLVTAAAPGIAAELADVVAPLDAAVLARLGVAGETSN